LNFHSGDRDVKHKLIVIEDKINRLLERFNAFAAHFGEWKISICIAVSAWLLSIIFYPPADIDFNNHYCFNTHTRLNDFLKLSADPFDRGLNEPIVAYRIITPLFAWLFGLKDFWAVSIQYIALVLAIIFIYKAVARRTDNAVALLACFILSLTYLTHWTNQYPGFPDSVTHLASIITMLAPSFWLAWVGSAVGLLNDERFILAVPFILLWHLNIRHESIKLKEVVKPLFGFLVGIACVLIIRHMLATGIIGPGIERPDEYHSILKHLLAFDPALPSWPRFLIGIFWGFKFAWIIVFLSVYKGWQKYPRWIMSIFGLFLFSASMSTMLVWDVSRSVAFFFPSIILATQLLYQINVEETKRVMIVSLCLCLLSGPDYATWIGLFQKI